MSQPLVLVVLWTFYPLWLAAGWLDYRHHRAGSVRRSNGVREAVLHLAMLLQVTAGLAATLAWLPSYPLMLGLLALALAYFATTSSSPRSVEDGTRDARTARYAGALFEFMPLFGLGLYFAEHGPRLEQLARPAWTLEWRTPALPAAVWLAVFLPVLAVAIAPGLAELRRAWLARPAQAT
jgi:hypothetical protein